MPECESDTLPECPPGAPLIIRNEDNTCIVKHEEENNNCDVYPSKADPGYPIIDVLVWVTSPY